MLNTYLDYLVRLIREHKLVYKHRNLRAEEWTKSNFELLSEIISDYLESKLTAEQRRKLGFTISGKTLANIFKKEYDISYPIDVRALTTLNKLVFFLGYEDWDDFADYVELTEQENAVQGGVETILRHIIEKAISAEFAAYQQLPNINVEGLFPYFMKDRAAALQIEEVLITYNAACWNISNPYNPSAVDLLDFQILSIDEHTAKVKTEEYWLLCWFDSNAVKYVRRYKNISHHTYLLQCNNGEWEIKTKASGADVLAIRDEV